MILLGYLFAVLMGLTLGLIGAGGSILTVPILVYFFQIKPILATTYSLLVVGLTALFGALLYYRKNLIRIKSAIIFIIPSTIAVIATRGFLVPNIPEKIFTLPKDNFLMLFFALLMLTSAFFMSHTRLKTKNEASKKDSHNLVRLIGGSLLVGFLTGLVGVGGGFLIVPVLILLFNLQAKEAVGTSLAIIATNALIGFKSDLLFGIKIDWIFLTLLSSLTIAGMFAGVALSKYFDGKKLKKLFALMVTVIALIVLLQQIFQLA